MAAEWIIETTRDPSNPQGVVLQLAVKDPQSEESVQLLRACGSMEDLRRGIDSIKCELDKALVQGERKLEAALKEGLGEKEITPEEVWKKMESLTTDAEMFEYFNSFGRAKREEFADYILSHANMFKGRGPVFSEHYDSFSHMLE